MVFDRLSAAIRAAALPAILVSVLVGCTSYDAPGGDKPWPSLSDIPGRPDPMEVDKRRRRLLGQYGDAGAALPQVKALPAQAPAGALRVAIIQFPRADAEIDDPAREILRQVSDYANQAGAAVWLFGYSSMGIELVSAGSARESAETLAAERVRSVGVALIEGGVPADRLELIARGAAEPAWLEATATGEAGNRRVEIYLVR